jgi:hypothetical protein
MGAVTGMSCFSRISQWFRSARWTRTFFKRLLHPGTVTWIRPGLAG